MIESRDIYWLAGVMEGEGCFKDTMRRNRKGCVPTITLAMTDCDVIEKASRILGSRINGPYQYGDNKKPWVVTSMTGKNAIGWMMTLYLAMGNRRQSKIRELISAWKTYIPAKGGPRKGYRAKSY